jgi:hypothetical protein
MQALSALHAIVPSASNGLGGDRDGEMGSLPSVPGMWVRLRERRGRAIVQLGCPYLPEELNVFCDQCRFNFFTIEGNPPCDDPLTCAHAAEPRSHVENLRTWEGTAGRSRA